MFSGNSENLILNLNDSSKSDYKIKIEKIFSRIKKDELVLILMNNSFESFFGFHVGLENEISMILLDYSVNEDVLKNILELYHPQWLWLPHEKTFSSTESYVLLNYRLNRSEYLSSINISKYRNLLLSTSGSTGSPKFVRISYENLYANAHSISTYLNIKKTDVTITNLPLSYSFGLSVVNSHLLAGSKVVFTDYSVVQKEFWDLVKEHKVTSLFGVPYTFEILDKMRFFRMDLPHLRLIGQAGGRMNPLLQEKYIAFCTQKGIEYYTMYGQTEATARMSFVPPHMAKEKLGSIGIPIPGGRFELRDENNQVIEATDSVGELVYLGPNVSLGYATCREDLMKGDENEGLLYTGDLARRDNDGYYYLVGRKNRFLKLFGNRVSLQDLEDKLQELGIESVCGGTDDKLIAYTTVADKMEFISTWLSDVTAIHRSAFEVKYIDRIPRNSSGKILYKELFGE